VLIRLERRGDCYGHRDATMILVAYRHGLRASEVCDLQWQRSSFLRDACMFTASRTGFRAYIRSAVRKLRREYPKASSSASEDAIPDPPTHASARLWVQARQRRPRCGALRHYLGHKSIQHTVRYTEMARDLFKDFWRN
jgi:type 1 fimbriae regulatory protein FimB/type 1 fimbriae regulatory protein FimE